MKKNISSPSIHTWLDSLFYCPSCTTWRTRNSYNLSRSCIPPSKAPSRHASTLSSSTAINATKDIPKRYKNLHSALSDVSKKASAHVNLSRLQLALQGLETEQPVTRVAVLGLDVQTTARRLVRLLLADPLEEQGQWERELTREDYDYRQGLLIRYGQPPNSSLSPQRTSIPVLYVPVSILERNNIEILISSVNAPNTSETLQNAQTTPSDIFLAPSVTTPTAANGRQTVIMQPVHNSVVVAHGLDELLAVAELLASTKFMSAEDRAAIVVAAEIAVDNLNAGGKTMIVNATAAEKGLEAIRRSTAEASIYGRKWTASGMPSLSTWFEKSSAVRSASASAIPDPIRELVSSLLTSATSSLRSQDSLAIRPSLSSGMNTAVKTNLDTAVDEFSRNAHNELQAGLASAWSSRNWRKLAWYKLFWRVDDVGLIVTDLVSNAWLPQTERAVYELSGRLVQAGITPVEASPISPPTNTSVINLDVASQSEIVPALQPQFAIVNPPPAEPAITNPSGSAIVSMLPVSQPVPLSSTVSRTRAAQMTYAIAELSSTAQQLVLRTLSITGLSAGLSGLTYFSITPGSFYEAGTIAALGTAFALWRMQGGWMTATKNMENSLFDEGRDVIQKVVERMRDLVNEAAGRGKEAVEESVEERMRREAREAVEKARQELQKLDGTKATELGKNNFAGK